MTNSTNEGIVRRFYEEVWNKGNFAIAEEILAVDYVRHDGLMEQVGARVYAGSKD